jgi:hypothetical protein
MSLTAVMNSTEKQAAFYRGYLIDDCSLMPLTITLATIVALWLLVYLVSAMVPRATPQTAEPAARASLFVTPPTPPRIHDHQGSRRV